MIDLAPACCMDVNTVHIKQQSFFSHIFAIISIPGLCREFRTYYRLTFKPKFSKVAKGNISNKTFIKVLFSKKMNFNIL